jgi:hypothetical protein
MPELVTHIEKRFRNLKIRSGQLSSNESMWSDVELQEAFVDILRAKSTDTLVLCLLMGSMNAKQEANAKHCGSC